MSSRIQCRSQRYHGFGSWLLHRDAAMPHRKAYGFLSNRLDTEDYVSYRQLLDRATRVATLLQAACRPGDRALLLFPPGLAYVAAIFGCLLSHAIAVPAVPPRPNRPMHRIQGIVRDCQPRVALTTTELWQCVEEQVAQTEQLRAMEWLRIDELDGIDAAQWAPPRLQPQSVALLQYTSGSTGRPKGVMVSHENLEHNSLAIHDKFGHHADSRGLIWLPGYHDMGLIGGILQPMFGGFPVTLMSPLAIIQHPLRWLEAVSMTRATTSGGPSFAYQLCAQRIDPSDIAHLDLSCWDMAFCGAEPIRPEVLTAFAEKFAPAGFRANAFYPCYGLAEATLIVAGACKGEPLKVRAGQASEGPRSAEVSLVGCGTAIDATEVRIVDPKRGNVLDDGAIGEIWISGPSVVQGYWWDPDLTATTFGARIRDLPSGKHWMRTGDYGFIDDGELFVTGRLKDLIIVAGRNVHPHDIEWAVAEAHPGIRPQGVAAFAIETDGTEGFVVAAEQVRTGRYPAGTLEKAIRKVLWDRLELTPHDIWLLPPATIPKTSSGKLIRFAVRDRYLAIHEQTPSEISSLPNDGSSDPGIGPCLT